MLVDKDKAISLERIFFILFMLQNSVLEMWSHDNGIAQSSPEVMLEVLRYCAYEKVVHIQTGMHCAVAFETLYKGGTVESDVTNKRRESFIKKKTSCSLVCLWVHFFQRATTLSHCPAMFFRQGARVCRLVARMDELQGIDGMEGLFPTLLSFDSVYVTLF